MECDELIEFKLSRIGIAVVCKWDFVNNSNVYAHFFGFFSLDGDWLELHVVWREIGNETEQMNKQKRREKNPFWHSSKRSEK